MLFELRMKCEVKHPEDSPEVFVGLFPTEKEAQDTGEARLTEFPSEYWGYEVEPIHDA